MKRLLYILPLLLASGFGQSVTVNGTALTVQVSSTSVSTAYTVPSGNPNLCLLVFVSNDGNGATATGVTATYNGVSMTRFPSNADAATGGGTATFTQIFALASPATGSNTLAITIPASSEIYYGAQSFYNCNQTTPLHNHVVATGTNPSLAITSGTSELVAAVADQGSGSGTIAFSSCTPSGATCTSSNNGGGGFSGSQAYSTVGETSTTVAFTSTSANAVATGFSIQPPSGGGAACPHTLALMGAGCS